MANGWKAPRAVDRQAPEIKPKGEWNYATFNGFTEPESGNPGQIDRALFI